MKCLQLVCWVKQNRQLSAEQTGQHHAQEIGQFITEQSSTQQNRTEQIRTAKSSLTSWPAITPHLNPLKIETCALSLSCSSTVVMHNMLQNSSYCSSSL
jgi:hypothetical protein